MIDIIQAAGWPIWPIILCSIIAIAIIGERFYSLRQSLVAPRDLLARVVQEYRKSGVTADMLNRVSQSSQLGKVLAAGLRTSRVRARS